MMSEQVISVSMENVSLRLVIVRQEQRHSSAQAEAPELHEAAAFRHG